MNSSISRRWGAFGLAFALLALASCGGGGGGGSTPPTPGSKLFVVDSGNHAIASMINPTPTSTVTIDRVIAGSNTGLGLPGGTPSVFDIPAIVLDAPNDRLYVATATGVVTFNNASLADGNTAPSHRMSGAIPLGGGGTLIVSFSWIDVDRSHDVLYSVDPTGEVHVYNNISALNSFNLAPNRTITPDFGGVGTGPVFGIAVDVAKDLLYVGIMINSSFSIIVFNSASNIFTTGTPRLPDKTITFPVAIGSMSLDTVHDRMYLAQSDGKVLVYDSFSTLLTGAAPAANRLIDITGGTSVQFYVFIDTSSRDKLYAVGNIPGLTPPQDQGFVVIIDNASTADDTAGPTSTGVVVAVNASNIRLSAVAVKP